MFATNCKSQDTSYIVFAKTFFSNIFNQKIKEGNYAYSRIDTTTISELKFYINKKTLKDANAKVKNSLLLTEMEVRYINNRLSNQNIEWDVKDYINSISIQSAVSRPNNLICRFSDPIFLRNESICLFYYELGPERHFCVYKNQNEKWILYITIFYSIS
jgi:hypothetical protein